MNMTKRSFLAVLLFLFSHAIAGNALAEDGDALKTMAGIMLHLNHYPSSGEKKMLRDISIDSANSAHIRTIAQAMANLQHTAAPDDQSKLKAVMADRKAQQEVRDLASIVLNINHKPSMADKKRLEKMM